TVFWSIAAIGVLAAYAALNEPIRFALLRLTPLLIAVMLVAACAGFGFLAPALLTRTALGIGVFGALSFVAALLHLARPVTYPVLILAGLVLGVRQLAAAF